MSIFQSTVVTKHLKSQNSLKIASQWKIYKNHFLNPVIQENIRNSKEEQYQGGFLIDLFVNVLGYTKNPTPDFNITTEFKNVKDSKKADGAIIINKVVKAVIELKGTNTIDLNKIEVQAFGYKNNQPECTYVITSNFEKLRFYIDNAIEHIEFNLFTLSEKDFELLYLCLAYENIKKDIPKKIKKESISQEDVITKKLYKDYSLFKRELHQSLVLLNPQYDALTLFKKSQKLLDRFLFLFFAEDRQLLPPNSVRLILKQWEKLKELDAYSPLFERYKKYFGYLNTGFKGKQYNIYAYNGGLFKPDEILDEISIDDELLYKHTLRLSEYDFSSEVDVNILGHIFENSLNDLDEIKAQLEGLEVDKSKSKRKKDGVFYTPKYITKYIVDNTIGILCEQKKTELQIIEEDYITDKKRQKKTIKPLVDKLTEYRGWLLHLTICDPACGSGAFLNQALDFLITEHSYIDELQAKLFGDAIVLSDVEKSILENNLFGVDLNEESVEIAKLSLWLRTALPNRKLNDLSNNIKCGNSLIDDPEIAGEKAFNWQQEFPQIFAKGGFDVIIGNPPYVNISTFSKDIHQYFKSEYGKIHTGYNDLMYYFLYKGINMLKKEGVFGMITSNYFLGNEYAKSLRHYLSTNISEILNFKDYLIFEDANVHTAIIFAEKHQKNKTVKYRSIKDPKESLLSIEPERFNTIIKERESLNEYWIFASKDKSQIIKKIATKGKLLGQIAEIEKGSTSGKNDVFTVSKEDVSMYNLEREVLRKNVKNGDISKYRITDRETFLIYTDNDTEIEKYPNILNYFNQHKEALSNRNEVKKGSYDWWRMERPRRKEVYDSKEKIIVPYRATNNRFAYDNEKRFNDGGDIRVLVIKDKNLQIKYVLGVLNSNLIDWFYGFIGKPKGNSREYFNEPLAKIPIFFADKGVQTTVVQLVDLITESLEKEQNINCKFSNYLQSKFEIKKLSKKLQNWHELEFGEFIKELNKATKAANKESVRTGQQEISLLTKKDEFEWLDLFKENKNKVQELQSQIKKTEKEIDAVVYELYELTQEEIEIVENS